MWLQPLGWDRQPANALGIDWSHPLATSLVFYGYPQGNTVVDLVSGNMAVRGTGCDLAVKPWNVGTSRQTDGGVLCATTPASSGVWRWGSAATQLDSQSLNNGPLTLFALGMGTTATTTPIIFSTADNFNGSGFGLCADDNAFFGPGEICQAFNSSLVTSGVAAAANQLTSVANNKLHFFGCGYDGTNVFSYYQGLFRNSGASALKINSSGVARQTQFGAMYSTGPSASACALGIAFNRILSLQEYQQLWTNPWALVKAQPAKFFIGAGAAPSSQLWVNTRPVFNF